VKVIGLGDADEEDGLLCEARLEGEVVTLPLGDLEDAKPNRRLIDDYCYWLHNWDDLCPCNVSGVTSYRRFHGKLTQEGKVSEPDVYWILEKWLDRHPKIRERQKDIRIVRGQWTTENGLKTEVIRVSIVAGDDIAGYDPQEDADLCEYWKAEDRYWQG